MTTIYRYVDETESCNPGILQHSVTFQHFIRDIRAKFGIPNLP